MSIFYFSFSSVISSTSCAGNSRTCPTCRNPQAPTNLTKLFFEFDDHNANLNVDDIIRNNDELVRGMETRQRAQLEVLTNKVLVLERQKQIDHMTIVELKANKDAAKREVHSLKLDLLVEQGLRRSHQRKLESRDFNNKDYPTNGKVRCEKGLNGSSSHQVVGPHSNAPTTSSSASSVPFNEVHESLKRKAAVNENADPRALANFIQNLKDQQSTAALHEENFVRSINSPYYPTPAYGTSHNFYSQYLNQPYNSYTNFLNSLQQPSHSFADNGRYFPY